MKKILALLLMFFTLIPLYATTLQSQVNGKDTLKKVELNEVVVKSRQKIHKVGNDVYIPTSLQKKVSMDGYDLLRNMAIPQLDIDAITNKATVRGKAVTFIVDNHIVTNPNDIKQLSPGDILKVEYDAMPTGEYAQYDCIVKFTTKRKDRGGNIMAAGMQGLNKNVGDYNGVVRFYRQKFNIAWHMLNLTLMTMVHTLRKLSIPYIRMEMNLIKILFLMPQVKRKRT